MRDAALTHVVIGGLEGRFVNISFNIIDTVAVRGRKIWGGGGQEEEEALPGF